MAVCLSPVRTKAIYVEEENGHEVSNAAVEPHADEIAEWQIYLFKEGKQATADRVHTSDVWGSISGKTRESVQRQLLANQKIEKIVGKSLDWTHFNPFEPVAMLNHRSPTWPVTRRNPDGTDAERTHSRAGKFYERTHTIYEMLRSIKASYTAAKQLTGGVDTRPESESLADKPPRSPIGDVIKEYRDALLAAQKKLRELGGRLTDTNNADIREITGALDEVADSIQMSSDTLRAIVENVQGSGPPLTDRLSDQKEGNNAVAQDWMTNELPEYKTMYKYHVDGGVLSYEYYQVDMENHWLLERVAKFRISDIDPLDPEELEFCGDRITLKRGIILTAVLQADGAKPYMQPSLQRWQRKIVSIPGAPLRPGDAFTADIEPKETNDALYFSDTERATHFMEALFPSKQTQTASEGGTPDVQDISELQNQIASQLASARQQLAAFAQAKLAAARQAQAAGNPAQARQHLEDAHIAQPQNKAVNTELVVACLKNGDTGKNSAVLRDMFSDDDLSHDDLTQLSERIIQVNPVLAASLTDIANSYRLALGITPASPEVATRDVAPIPSPSVSGTMTLLDAVIQHEDITRARLHLPDLANNPTPPPPTFAQRVEAAGKNLNAAYTQAFVRLNGAQRVALDRDETRWMQSTRGVIAANGTDGLELLERRVAYLRSYTPPPVSETPSHLSTPFPSIPPTATPPVGSSEGYSRYANSKHGFSVLLPALLAANLRERSSGDSAVATSSDGNTKLLVQVKRGSGSLTDLYTEWTAEHTSQDPGKVVGYKVLRNGWFVVSGHDGERGYYVKVVARGSEALFLCLEYDDGGNVVTSEMITAMSRSFTGEP